MNERRWSVAGGLALVLTVLLAVSPARAVIEVLTPLEKIINKDSQFIFTAKVVKIDPKKPSVVLEVGDALKGKVPFTRLPINLTGDDYATKHDHTPQLLKRLAEKLSLVVFVNKSDKKYLGLAYSNGTWLQLIADDEGENPVWSFTHCEPYLRRTFKGTTAEMKEAVSDSLSGKKTAPKPDPKEKPGLGPEVEEKPKEEKPASNPPPRAGGVASGPLFAVVPSVVIGGFLAFLAMLFPTVFGGLTGLLKRWLVMLSVASLNATLIWLQDLFAQELLGTWFGSRAALWLTMTGLTVAGLLWAWRRNLAELTSSPAMLANGGDPEATESLRLNIPSRYEQTVLLILSGFGIILFAVGLLLQRMGFVGLGATPWRYVLVLWIGIWCGTLYVLFVRRSYSVKRTRPALASEGVMLGGMVLACLALGQLGGSAIATDSAGGGTASNGGRGVTFLEPRRLFAPPGANGAIDGKPLINGDRLYVAGAHSGAFGSSFGAVYCLERSSGNVLWRFNADGKMKQVYSSPCLADGKIYIGEGFHSDSDCKLYCLDAATGKKLWDRQTQSHTESSPCVVDGRVYCGAGGDGLLCLNAATGEDIWQYRGGHIDCSPVVVGQRVYAGSAVDRDITGPQETAMFCLDASTGKEIWRVKTNLPVWGKPVVAGEQAFFPLGNGDATQSDDKAPAGAIVCVAAGDGKEAWRFDVSDGVIEGPAIDLDRGQLYFGSRDGNCYCIGRHDGRPRWKHDLGSAVVASPALAVCSCCGVVNSVFAISSGEPDRRIPSRVCCLDPLDGHELWQQPFQIPDARVISPPAVTVERTPEGDRRTVYFGATIDIKPADPTDNQVVLYALKDQWKEE
jgi:outer membrane protein assembly factor BamB